MPMGLHADEVELIKAAGPENKNSAVVMIGGNMIMTVSYTHLDVYKRQGYGILPDDQYGKLYQVFL